MLNLLAKLGLDISGFTRGLTGAKTAAAQTSGDISKEAAKDLGQLLKSWIGIGAIVGFAATQFDKVTAARNKAMLSGTSVRDELAREEVLKKVGDASKVTAEEFNRLMEAAKQTLPEENVLDQLANSADRMKANLAAGQTQLVGFLASALRGVSKVNSLIFAGKEAAQAFLMPLAPAEENQNSFAVARARAENARKTFNNRLRLDEEIIKAEDANRVITPGPPEAPKDKAKPVTAAAQKSFPTFDPRIAAGGLASAGLFFGGAGNPLLREAKTQTDLTRQSVTELKRLVSAVREEL